MRERETAREGEEERETERERERERETREEGVCVEWIREEVSSPLHLFETAEAVSV